MMVLAGEAAYTALRAALEDASRAEAFRFGDIPFERMRRAICDDSLSPLDLAVRLRHALRYADLSLSARDVQRALPLPKGSRWPDIFQCQSCGLVRRAGGLIEALPWSPGWLEHGGLAVDARAMMQEERRWIQRLPEADLWLKAHFGYKHFRGPGQALSVRSALHMPNDRALLGVLPTGEGKSLVFQALAAAHPGQVVAVVVPTVALAQDHENSLANYPHLARAYGHAYVGGEDQRNAEIVERVRTGEQGLLFAAPEAVVGRLQPALLEAARGGKLAAVVIDEAHLVDAWGTDFRNEFQLLAALVSELQAKAPPERKPRLVFLSATVTQAAYETIQRLYSPERPLALVQGARLRPEPETWIAPMVGDEEERRSRILEAILHLPRPAILYVTKVEDAQEWYEYLRRIGLRSVRALHGRSSASDRAATVKAWGAGEVDLVVGTSAFGLGIDYAHVRTVIHACLPESLDRYYQEVGRSGRDNHASIALLVPTYKDVGVAEAVSSQKIISVEKGLARWSSMFSKAERDLTAAARFYVDTAVPPPYDMDMMGERNDDWNGRVLSLMARAGFIALAGVRFNPDKRRAELAVDIRDDGHYDPASWRERIEPLRKVLLEMNMRRFGHMRAVASEFVCPSQRLVRLYQLDTGEQVLPVVPACGGCIECRKTRKHGWFSVWPNPPTAPWPAGALSKRLLGQISRGCGVVERDSETSEKPSQRRVIRELIECLWNDGMRKCISVGVLPEPVAAALAERPWCTAQAADSKVLSSSGLPPGPAVVWIADDVEIPEHCFAPREAGQERIFIIPQGLANPDRPAQTIADRFPIIPFISLYESLQT